jgi:hypothetical protein
MIKFNSKASSPLKINTRNQFNLKKLKLFLRGTGTQKGSVRAKYKSKGTFSTDFEAIFIPNYGTLCFVMVYFVIYVIFFGSTNFNLSSAPQQPRNEQPSIQDCDITLFTKTCTSGK